MDGGDVAPVVIKPFFQGSASISNSLPLRSGMFLDEVNPFFAVHIISRGVGAQQLFRQLGVVRENPLERFRVIVVHGEKRFRQL